MGTTSVLARAANSRSTGAVTWFSEVGMSATNCPIARRRREDLYGAEYALRMLRVIPPVVTTAPVMNALVQVQIALRKTGVFET